MSKLSAIYNVPSEEIRTQRLPYYPITGAEDWTAMGARLAILYTHSRYTLNFQVIAIYPVNR